MTNILIVNSSPNPDGSTSRALTEQFAAQFLVAMPDTHITRRDVGLNPIPHVNQGMVNAYYTSSSNYGVIFREGIFCSLF